MYEKAIGQSTLHMRGLTHYVLDMDPLSLIFLYMLRENKSTEKSFMLYVLIITEINVC